jgi:hypothetical protein
MGTKRLRSTVTFDTADPGRPWTAAAACPSCGSDLGGEYHRAGIEFATRCRGCGREFAVTLRADGSAAVRRPYGADGWEDVVSSNLAAAGRVGTDLLVRFAKGGVYRYAAAGHLLPDLLAAPSKGAFFATRVRGLPAVLLCCVYGCVHPADREQRQVLCRDHLDEDRSR